MFIVCVCVCMCVDTCIWMEDGCVHVCVVLNVYGMVANMYKLIKLYICE